MELDSASAIEVTGRGRRNAMPLARASHTPSTPNDGTVHCHGLSTASVASGRRFTLSAYIVVGPPGAAAEVDKWETTPTCPPPPSQGIKMNGTSILWQPFDAAVTLVAGSPTRRLTGTAWHLSICKTPFYLFVVSVLFILSVAVWLHALPSPGSYDPREPPLLRPKLPFLGHIINIVRFQGEFHSILRKANPSMSLATLPMLSGKAYAIFDPNLIHVVLRSKSATFEPYIFSLVQTTFDLSDEAFTKVIEDEKLLPDLTDAFHLGFQVKPLRKMTRRFLATISSKLNTIGSDSQTTHVFNAGRERALQGGLEVENLYLWCRDLMTVSTTKALYGNSDPFSKDLRLISALCEKRDVVDPTTSLLIAQRADTLRRHGFNGEEIAKMETIQAVIATTNAIPTFFWLLIFVLSRPELLTQMRTEIEGALNFEPVAAQGDSPDNHRVATLDVSRFEHQLPLMTSCYRETLRLINHSVSMRRVTSDISLTAADGKTYVLKEGVDVQMPAGVTHGDTTIWGPDAGEFRAERFLPEARVSGAQTPPRASRAERSRKAAFFPFGGGKHLCPGRNLAFEEIMGFMALILLRMDLEPMGMRFEDIKMEGARLTAPSCKPINNGAGLGARLKKRDGWENTTIAIKCG
ncbi:hypothetical protein PCL_09272 [Purpureocillium lilacinum]|uniref:Prostacyclin synthase n=1 Tax=Purpureocillium lilacinum TaxID=33203 RepID=A0A2U3EHJ6_PURLI|nr:hypothetical protein PCL_09272 [Purpureocillium lilacinum]